MSPISHFFMGFTAGHADAGKHGWSVERPLMPGHLRGPKPESSPKGKVVAVGGCSDLKARTGVLLSPPPANLNE